MPGEHGKGPGAEERTPASRPLSAICGRPAVLSGIVSGLEANVGQWPWQVSIRQGLSHVCAASLISKQWVLTVATHLKAVGADSGKLLPVSTGSCLGETHQGGG